MSVWPRHQVALIRCIVEWAVRGGVGVDVGEVWAYRARRGDPLARVAVMRFGTGRPARVRVRFLDDEFEGKEEWVPPARLKVAWADAERWLAQEQRWLRVQDASSVVRDSAEHEASWMVLERVGVEEFLIGMESYRHAVLAIRDVAGFEAALGLVAADLTNGDGDFVDEDGAVVAAWPALREVARRAAALHADDLLGEFDRERQRWEQRAVYGEYYRSRSPDDGYIRPEICVEVDAEAAKAWEVIRGWCGADAGGRLDELGALRAEVIRLGTLVEHAIDALRRGGATAYAAEVERELGVPVELLRRSNRQRP